MARRFWRMASLKGFVGIAKRGRIGVKLNYLYCEKCGLHENDVQESLYSCDCKKGKMYDLDRALSEIEEFFSENNASNVRNSWLDYPNGKNHPS